jgi:hypothetical protein
VQTVERILDTILLGFDGVEEYENEYVIH